MKAPHTLLDAQDAALRDVYGFNPLTEEKSAIEAGQLATGAYAYGRQHDSEADGEKAQGLARLLGAQELARQREQWEAGVQQASERAQDSYRPDAEFLATLGPAIPIEDARGWLLDLLENGPVTVREITKLALERGLSWRTVERAKRDLGNIRAVRTTHGNQGRGFWAWALIGR